MKWELCSLFKFKHLHSKEFNFFNGIFSTDVAKSPNRQSDADHFQHLVTIQSSGMWCDVAWYNVTNLDEEVLHVQDRRNLIQCGHFDELVKCWASRLRRPWLNILRSKNVKSHKFYSFCYNPGGMLFINGSSDLKVLHFEKPQQVHLLILKAHSISTLCLSFHSSTTSFSSLLLFLSDRHQTRGFLFIVR